MFNLDNSRRTRSKIGHIKVHPLPAGLQEATPTEDGDFAGNSRHFRPSLQRSWTRLSRSIWSTHERQGDTQSMERDLRLHENKIRARGDSTQDGCGKPHKRHHKVFRKKTGIDVLHV